MKKLRLLISLCVALFSVACSYNELPENLKTTTTFEDKIALNVETRAETYEGQALDQEYFVTATDLENFVNFRREESDRSNLSVREVKSYGFDSSQTLFYILNYDKGWEVVAADKRVQPTLAHGDDGTFTMDTDNEPMKFWMNMLAEGVLKTRQTSDIATRTSADNAEEGTTEPNPYLEFWESISPSDSSRSGTLTPYPGLHLPGDGLYSYSVDSETYTTTNQYGPHIATQWGQKAPWNAYCPLKYNDSTDRSPAGCVAISASHMIYYLHNHFNMNSITVPTTASCTGSIDGYVRTFGDFTSSAWNNMAETLNGNNNFDLSAMFIGFIGELAEINYGIDSSGGHTTDLPENVFDIYGISCQETNDYDENIVINSVKNSMPIIIHGYDALLFGEGHSWIIDG
ncbi:MAG: C10 family peptidase, partial [Tidjanibacter sp.]|nr:C10 family peptidase [Tidjanibacter sp.]